MHAANCWQKRQWWNIAVHKSCHAWDSSLECESPAGLKEWLGLSFNECGKSQHIQKDSSCSSSKWHKDAKSLCQWNSRLPWTWGRVAWVTQGCSFHSHTGVVAAWKVIAAWRTLERIQLIQRSLDKPLLNFFHFFQSQIAMLIHQHLKQLKMNVSFDAPQDTSAHCMKSYRPFTCS